MENLHTTQLKRRCNDFYDGITNIKKKNLKQITTEKITGLFYLTVIS